MPNCTVCGEPMQPGEEMFKFHGSLGPCPKPPLPRPARVIVEYVHRDAGEDYWIDVVIDRAVTKSVGPFGSAVERQRAQDDFLDMIRSTGGEDLPTTVQ